MNAPVPDKIVAVIVTYNPDVELLAQNHRALAAQVAHVIVVDNSDQPELARQVERLLSAADHASYVHNQGNQGIAHALNRGAELATQHGAGWVLTMDQDSVLVDHHVDRMVQFLARQPRPERVAAVGTPYSNAGRTSAKTPHGGAVKALITSGSLLRLSALHEVGGFREELFIDYVDFDLSFRLRKAGYLLLECHDVLFEHRVGTKQGASLFGVTIFHSNYSPVRSYYISRNRVVFFKENVFFDPGFVVAGMWAMLKETIKIMLGERQKWRKLRAILTGIKDGVLMRLGKYPGRF